MSAAWRAGSSTLSPSIIITGSPGMMCTSRNVRRMIPMKVGMTRSRRLRMKGSIAVPARKEAAGGGSPPPAFLHCLLGLPHAFEVVEAQRIHDVVLHFLAHRHVDDAMRDRDHRRFLVRDLLRLLVVFRPL